MADRLNVAYCLGTTDFRIGGPAYSVVRLASAVQEDFVRSSLLSFHYPYQDQSEGPLRGVPLFRAPYFFFGRFTAAWNPWMDQWVERTLRQEKIQLLHDNGLWLYSNFSAWKIAGKLQMPLMISIRGMLEPWALESKGLKKKLAWHFYQKRILRDKIFFHATSRQEAESIRRLGFKQPIAIVANGIDIPTESNFETQGGSQSPIKRFLFLSRVHPKKGLERLIDIWHRLAPVFQDWDLVIAGEGEPSYVESLKKAASKKGLQKRIHWMGSVEGEEKKRIYSQANLFILPTFSENFGVAIGEALAAGIPVITTEGTPWDELRTRRCGWYVDNHEAAIERALVEALQSPLSELKEMGGRGQALIREKYTWPEIAKQMADTYRWILKRGDQPDCVRLD